MNRMNPRRALIVTWMLSAVVTVPLALAVKYWLETAGWLMVLGAIGGAVAFIVWVLLGLLPLLIAREYPSRLTWAWIGLAMIFVGCFVGLVNMPDAWDDGRYALAPWWGENEVLAAQVAGAFVIVSLAGHLVWIVACMFYQVRSRPAPEVL